MEQFVVKDASRLFLLVTPEGVSGTTIDSTTLSCRSQWPCSMLFKLKMYLLRICSVL